MKGIGPKFAHRIVQQFGKDTLTVIEDNPERLLEAMEKGALSREQMELAAKHILGLILKLD